MDIKEFIIKNIINHPRDIVNLAMLKYNISRPAVHKHLNYLIRDGRIQTEGNTKGRYYSLTSTDTTSFSQPKLTIPNKIELLDEIETELSAFVGKIRHIIKHHTQLHVDLKMHVGSVCMSRDQAKRVLAGLDKFKHITLDFKDVSTVGQGFVDEVFRVFQNQHPDITFIPIHMNENVEFMVKRGLPQESK